MTLCSNTLSNINGPRRSSIDLSKQEKTVKRFLHVTNIFFYKHNLIRSQKRSFAKNRFVRVWANVKKRFHPKLNGFMFFSSEGETFC